MARPIMTDPPTARTLPDGRWELSYGGAGNIDNSPVQNMKVMFRVVNNTTKEIVHGRKEPWPDWVPEADIGKLEALWPDDINARYWQPKPEHVGKTFVVEVAYGQFADYTYGSQTKGKGWEFGWVSVDGTVARSSPYHVQPLPSTPTGPTEQELVLRTWAITKGAQDAMIEHWKKAGVTQSKLERQRIHMDRQLAEKPQTWWIEKILPLLKG